jgi:hypothetical protein
VLEARNVKHNQEQETDMKRHSQHGYMIMGLDGIGEMAFFTGNGFFANRNACIKRWTETVRKHWDDCEKLGYKCVEVEIRERVKE